MALLRCSARMLAAYFVSRYSARAGKKGTVTWAHRIALMTMTMRAD